MSEGYFVMLNTMNGGIMPMVNDDDQTAIYKTEMKAREDAQQNPVAQAFGYEVFKIGDGV